MNKNQTIALMIAAKIAEGMTIDAAIDAILGAGTYRKLADELHDAFNKKDK